MGRVSDARQRLIDATIELIRQEGYAQLTVDAICERAAVKKGSFYYFFASRDELVLAALDWHWERRKVELDALFSPTVAPLDRLRAYFDDVHRRQVDLRRRYGVFVGCFYSAVGVEVGKRQSPAIARRVQAILAHYEAYYESALREAVSRKLIKLDDIPGKAKALFAYMEGVLSQARIQDDVGLLRHLADSSFQFLGIAKAKRAA